MTMSISSVGMASALGLDWETSCAASRAGILRASTLNHFRVQEGDPWEVSFVTAHEATLLTHGFEGQGRLLRLLSGAFADLQKRIPDSCDELPIFLSLPSQDRTTVDDETLDDDTGEPIPPVPILNQAEDLVTRAAQLGKWRGHVRLADLSIAGRTAVAASFQSCLAAFNDSRIESALVGTVDSLLDDETLAWLKNSGRLKHAAAATGLMPGEAAVLFLVSRGVVGRKSLGTVEAVSFADEHCHFESGKPAGGKGLSAVILQVAQRGKWPGQDLPWVVSDQTGETFRAADWGHALHRLVAQDRVFGKIRVSLPAISFGDTGTASASVGVACVLAAWKRGYAPSTRCCISSSSDAAQRAAFLVSSPELMSRENVKPR